MKRIHLIEPLAYDSFAEAMKRSYLILTDSGGIQEEAPSLGKPVLVLRSSTERSEGIRINTVKTIGTKKGTIVSEVSRILNNPEIHREMSKSINPYGDGQASFRILTGILYYFGQSARPENFAGI